MKFTELYKHIGWFIKIPPSIVYELGLKEGDRFLIKVKENSIELIIVREEEKARRVEKKLEVKKAKPRKGIDDFLEELDNP